ncbi:MAG: hypothetical protein GF405_07230 [Candidatus Eisenbacteria bacterium]|nr:hypothetical protein [Candidatus Eisenbacteria bacterium]
MSYSVDTRRFGTPGLVLGAAAAFALVLGGALGIVGLDTTGFRLSIGPFLALQIVGAAFALFALLACAVIGVARLARRRFAPDADLRRVVHTLTALSAWGLLTVTFLPLKGSEAFVQAGRLTTIQLNMIGLAAVLIAGYVLGLVAAWAAVRVRRLLTHRLTPPGLRTLAGALAAALLIVALLGPGARVPGAGVSRRSAARVAVIGVDGCDWDMLGPLVEAGRLPTFERLMEEGTYGPLLSLEPLVSPRIWTTIATGRLPSAHGIEDFVDDSGTPVNATMRRAPTIWEVVSASGGVVNVIGWYVTWPVDDVRGVMISDRMHTLARAPLQAYHALSGEPTDGRLERFGRFSFDPGYGRYDESDLRYQRNRIVDEPLRWGFLRDTIYGAAAEASVPRYHPDFVAVYYRGVDFVQHFFWQYSQPDAFTGVDREAVAAYGDVIPNYYEFQDALLARLLDSLGPDMNVIIVSDHGFQARLDRDPSKPQLTGMHDLRGVYIASGPAFRNGGLVEGPTILDIAPTALAVMGVPVSEEMEGRVLTEIVRQEHLASHPVTTVPSYGPGVRDERQQIESSMDESIRDQLRSLGYIE